MWNKEGTDNITGWREERQGRKREMKDRRVGRKDEGVKQSKGTAHFLAPSDRQPQTAVTTPQFQIQAFQSVA